MNVHRSKAPALEEKYLECLKTQFGHQEFHEEQLEVISSILNDGRDNFLCLKPGYGKSLCYQFPSVYCNTITIVISPFISLMKDQVKSLVKRDIKACLLGTGQFDSQVITDVLAGMYNIVYMAPECRAADDVLIELRDRIKLIAVDEAHFIPKWGDSFRFAYRRLTEHLKLSCPRVPIIATTSFATKRIRNDIVNTLNMDNPQIYMDKLDRPNLELIVKEMSDADMWSDIGPFLEDVSGSIIIHCLTKNKADELKEVLIKNDVNCDVYHSDIEMHNRSSAQDKFMSGSVNVIVATVCFGAGLDKPDIRLCIHYGAADDMETYYQQIGMAGRDGKPTKCVLFYDKNCSEAPFPKLDMKRYTISNECRRQFILSEFEEDCSGLTTRPDCCDICCKRKLEGVKTIKLSA